VGEADAEILPDRVYRDQSLWLVLEAQSEFSLGAGLAGYWNLQKVSDDAYFTDLSDRLVVTSQQTLPREAGLVYNRGPFSFLTRIQTFQTLQDPAQSDHTAVLSRAAAADDDEPCRVEGTRFPGQRRVRAVPPARARHGRAVGVVSELLRGRSAAMRGSSALAPGCI
jgi:LPS-assembly protein